MKRFACVFVAITSNLCFAQELTLTDVRKEVQEARDALEKVVTFCQLCEETGKIRGEECVACKGHPVTLKSEGKIYVRRSDLEKRASDAGVSADHYADFDMGGRLETLEESLEPETAEMLAAYVKYRKVCQKRAELIKTSERLTEITEKTVAQLDALIERHGSRLIVPSLKLFYEEDPVGKVGTFKLYGKTGTVRVDGKDMDRFEMRTLKDWSILVIKTETKRRRGGYIVAEIVGKGEYQTEDGKSIKAIVLQPW